MENHCLEQHKKSFHTTCLLTKAFHARDFTTLLVAPRSPVNKVNMTGTLF
jgi:hypothetical protein